MTFRYPPGYVSRARVVSERAISIKHFSIYGYSTSHPPVFCTDREGWTTPVLQLANRTVATGDGQRSSTPGALIVARSVRTAEPAWLRAFGESHLTNDGDRAVGCFEQLGSHRPIRHGHTVEQSGACRIR
jgi:hypothetical protein